VKDLIGKEHGERISHNRINRYLVRHGPWNSAHPGEDQAPQTSGKIERLFETMASQIRYHNSLGGMIEWYNTERPRMSLGMAALEEAFLHRMNPERMLGQTSHMLNREHFNLNQTPR